MENTTKANNFVLTKGKMLRILILMLFVFLIGRAPVMGENFPTAIAVIAYMVSRNTVNIYLIIPIAAGILPYYTRGYDPWGDLIAMCICGLFFISAHHIKLQLWHKATIAASISIVCTSIYRLATVTVYKMDTQTLIFEGFLVFIMVFLIDSFYKSITGKNDKNTIEIQLAALAAGCLLTTCGAGLSFLVWPAVVFLSLWAATYLQSGQALFMTVASGAAAALVDQAQWGLLMTVIIGICGLSLCRKYGMLPAGIVFLTICFALRSAESGVVLGVDNYCLFLGAASFFAVNWKFKKTLRKILLMFAAGDMRQKDEADPYILQVLEERSAEMADLTDLYSTYLDKRSILANQFEVTEQIIDNIRCSANKSARRMGEKFDADIAVSQCAASGVINGDCCGWNDIGDGRIAMIVSDGMGKGKKAASESLMVVKTIMALLRSGVSTELTLKMINTVMLMKDDEDSFATVDLIIVDKKTGHTKFYKIGAAPTLIRRKNNVEEVQLSAVPLGIVNGLKIRYVETTLKRDDWIIMMSDGISDGGDGRGFLPQIKETVLDVRSGDPRTMSNLILNQASDSYIGKERDDLTVMVARMI